MNDLHRKLGSPSHRYKTIHVAGTNGKGTVSLNIARNLEKNGYKVGLFTSPHFDSISERISTNGRLISEERLLKLYEENKEDFKELTFFDLLTLIAFVYFEQEGVDFAVIETGVGGLLDPTNIIKPILSVITNISFDHEDFLGTTLEKIAFHKAGIIKENTPVVLGPFAQVDVCLQKALKCNAKVINVNSKGKDYLKENKLIADAALKELGVDAGRDFYSLPGRFEVHGNVIFDMAHNLAGFKALRDKVRQEYRGKKIIALWNMSHAKEVDSCLSVLESFVDRVYFFPFPSDRLMSIEKATSLGLEIYNGQTSDIIIVCGSIYYMNDAKKVLLKS